MFTEAEKYLSQVKVDKSPHTLRSYTGSLVRFCNEMKITSPEEIVKLSSVDIQDYLYNLKNNGLSASSVNCHARNLIAFFNWLKDNGFENDLHAKRFHQEKTIKLVPTPEEIKNMISASTGKRKLLIAMLAFTGARREETVNIKMEDISGCYITLHGKGRKERKIALHEDVCKLLNEYISKRDCDFPYLFYTRKHFLGGDSKPHKLTTEAVRSMVKVAMKNAGIAPERIEKMSAHSIRRFFSVYLLRNNVSIGKIQLLLGHSSPNTTVIYLQSAGSDIADEDVRNLPTLMD